MRRSTIFLTAAVLGLVMASALFLHAGYERSVSEAGLEMKKRLVKDYALTDLSLFTEARYTRHPSLADRHTAFQDYPFSFEHFPSGSLVPVPPGLRKSPEKDALPGMER